ncbi:MAG TPA: hypothetical protein VLM83_06245, partial [Anaerolineales bacterium]|nr:hypothetical protein [Anaerolineales bacterium]
MGGDDSFAVRSIRVVYGEVDRSLPGFWIVSGKYNTLSSGKLFRYVRAVFSPHKTILREAGCARVRQYLVDAMH